MKEYIWIFPVLFVFHDFEEIIGFGIWYNKNKQKLKNKYPKIAIMIDMMFSDYSTEGMAIAVLEELTLCIVICILGMYFDMYVLWIGVFIIFVIHMIMHIVQSAFWGNYVPSLITSIIEIPISIIIIYQCLIINPIAIGELVKWNIIALILILVNLKFAHFLMHKFTRWKNRLVNK